MPLVPYLSFGDADAMLAFLRDGLGFETVTEQRDDQGGLVHVELRRGDDVVMGGAGVVDVGASPGLYLVLDDVAGTFDRLCSLGATVVYPPEETEWGTQRARLRDPDGHEWTIGTYRPGQSW